MNVNALTSLYTAIVDARNGYGEAVKDAQRPDMKTLFQGMIALHERALAELRAALDARGAKADDRGSFMSTVHETVISVRSAVTGLNENALSAFATGEERILNSYDGAIEEARGDLVLRQTLESQREALRAAIEAMKAKSEQA